MPGCPVKSSPPAATSGDAGASSGGCPVAPAAQKAMVAAAVGQQGCGAGVDGEEVNNPANHMPASPNQQPSAGQRKALPTERVTSSIPSGTSAEPLWVYPSQQMFFNAMRRKGYSPREEEMNAVVAIHNSVNERAWSQVLEWEQALHPECLTGLRLLRFQGKPDEPTLKARANSLVGYSAPFDRHDWVLSRCGKEVTYLIDFYNGKPTPLAPVSMHIDARPAADDLESAWDRVRMPALGMWRAASTWWKAASS